MKIKEGFILRKVAGENIVISSNAVMNLNAMITLNETGRFLWEHMQEETTEEMLVKALLAEYDVEEVSARNHVAKFVKKLNDNGFLA